MTTSSEKSPFVPLKTKDGSLIPVAIIDDTEQNLYLLSRYLKRAGFEVWEGHNGADALRLAAQLPKLIILDVKLPDMIGYEVCRKIKSNPATAHIPVVHTSATYTDSEDRVEGIEGGADAYFTSPLRPRELIATVRALVRVYDAEEEAGATIEQWRSSFDAISSAACLINGAGKIERCNAVLAKLAGMPREEIEGTSFVDFASTGVTSALPYTRMRETQQRETLEMQGRDRWWLVTADPLFDESGAWSGAICILTDISERKASEAQRRRSEKILSEFFENAPIGLLWMNEDGAILRANRAVSEMLGYSREECAGRRLEDFHPRPQEIDHVFAQLQRGEAVVERETQFRCQDGSLRDIMLSSNPVWEEGILVHLQFFLRDITESKQAAQELSLAREKQAGELEKQVAERTVELERIVQSLESYSSSIAHDLRAPLRAMEGYSEALVSADYGELNDQGKECARRIATAARRMDQLIQELLEYGRLSQADLPTEAVNLGEVVESVLPELAEVLETSEYDVEVGRPLPTVKANRLLLQQVLQNLLTNALRFVEPGARPKVVISSEERSPSNVRLCIRDNGIGIDPADHDRIFNIFERLHGEAEYGGTGIGLAIVKKGIEKMGGQVGVESPEGGGSLFWVELPKAKAR